MFKPRFMPYFDADDGISAIGGAAATEPEPAEPDDDDPSEGNDDPPEPDGDPDNDPDGGEPAEPANPQSPEENAKFAAIRRKYDVENKRLLAELEAERASKKQYADQIVSGVFQGQVNPYTNTPIETAEDYELYQQMQQEEILQNLGVPKDYIKREIENSPLYKSAQQILEMQQQQQSRMAFETQLAEITKLNPNIKGIDDLLAMPEKEEFDRYVSKGYELIDAYKLVHKDVKKKPNTADTKDHLIPAGGTAGSSKEKDIPSDEVSTWKEMYPDETTQQLRARYNRYLARTK